jgi:hypothetical protein
MSTTRLPMFTKSLNAELGPSTKSRNGPSGALHLWCLPPFSLVTSLALVGLVLTTLTSLPGLAQEKSGQASISSSIGNDGTGTIIVEARGQLPEPPVFYTARANATAQVGSERIEQVIQLAIKVIQGDAKTLSFGLNGESRVTEVQGANIQSWSVRRAGSDRFLDLHLKENAAELKPVIKLRSSKLELPATIDLTHLTPGDSVGFDSTVHINYASGVEGTVTSATGFAPLDAGDKADRFQTATGGQITLSVNRDGTSPGCLQRRREPGVLAHQPAR